MDRRPQTNPTYSQGGTLCKCGCGAPISQSWRQVFAGPACRKRHQRKLDAAEKLAAQQEHLLPALRDGQPLAGLRTALAGQTRQRPRKRARKALPAVQSRTKKGPKATKRTTRPGKTARRRSS